MLHLPSNDVLLLEDDMSSLIFLVALSFLVANVALFVVVVAVGRWVLAPEIINGGQG